MSIIIDLDIWDSRCKFNTWINDERDDLSYLKHHKWTPCYRS